VQPCTDGGHARVFCFSGMTLGNHKSQSPYLLCFNDLVYDRRFSTKLRIRIIFCSNELDIIKLVKVSELKSHTLVL
jgi:hypothetical protein